MEEKQPLVLENLIHYPTGNKLWVEEYPTVDSSLALPQYNEDKVDVYARVLKKGTEVEYIDLNDFVFFKRGTAYKTADKQYIVREGDVISVVSHNKKR